MRARFAGATLLLAILSAALLPTPAVAQSAPSATASSLIVKVVGGLTIDQQNEIVARNGGTLTSSIPALRLLVVTVLVQDVDATLARYRTDPQVQSVEQNTVRVSESVPSDPLYVNQWALPKIGFDQVFGVITPTGTAKVALLDTGVDASHPELAGKVLPGRSTLDGSNGMTDPSGHGTWLAGIIAAQTDTVPADGIAAVAYAGVQIVPVTVLNSNGEGQDSDVIAGVIWAADHGADVILMAFSAPDFSQNLQDAIDYAWSKGAVVVAAVGNNAVNTPTFPAGDRGVMGVAATDQNDALASFSNDGQAVFIAAPGVDIQTIDVNGQFIVISGSSASAAYVAGLAAFMKAVDPTLTNGIIVGRIARNADPAGTQDQTGNGRINMPRALADTSTEFIEPAGAAPVGNGGPFVGPYQAAARNWALTFAGTGNGSVTVTPNTGTVNAPVSCGGTGADAASQTITSTCTNVSTSANGAVVTFAANAGGGSSFAGWSGQSNLSSSTCSGTTTPCSAVLGANATLTVNFTSQVTNFKVEAVGGGAIGSQTAGSQFSIKVTAQNASNATVTSFNGQVTISSTGALSAGSGTTANFVAGVLASHSVTISNTGSFTITATGLAPNTAATGTSNAFAVNPGASSAANSTITGTSPVVADGVAASTVTITLKDANTNPVPGITPTFTATDTGSTNVYGACSVSDASGVSTCTLKSTKAEVKTLSISTPVVKAGGTVTFTAGALDHFLVESGGGGTIPAQTAGTAFNIRMTAQDVNNNTVTTFTTTVALTTTAGTISPTTSGVFAAGVRTESVTLTQAGAAKTITATASGKSGTSNAFNVAAGALDHFLIEAAGGGSIGSQTAGTPFSIQITAQDASNNTVTSFTGTVALSTNAGTMTPTTSSAFTAGVLATQSVTVTQAGSGKNITATASGKTGTSNNFTVSAGAFTKFLVEAGAGGNIATQAVGSPFSIRITAQDANNNPVTSFAGTVDLSTTAGTITPTTSGSFVAGVRTESVTVTQSGTGKTITATRTGGSETGTSNPFTVNAGALAKLLVEAAGGGNIGTQTAGIAFNIRITAQDANGNTVTSFDGNGNKANLTSSGSLVAVTGSPIAPTAAFTNGVLANYSVSITNTGTFTITATTTGPSNGFVGTSNSFTVNPGALNNFLVEKTGGGAIAAQTAGVPFSVRVTARDAFNNTKTDFGGTAVLTSNATLVGAPLTSGIFTAGVLDPQSVTISSTGAAVTVTATNGGSTGTSNAFAVNARTTSTAVSCDTPVSVGQGSTCTATVTDTSPGTATTPTGTVNFTASGAGVSPASTSCTLNGGAGSASCQVVFTGSAVDTITVSATYAADTTHATSSGGASIIVNKRDTSTSVGSSLNPSNFGDTVSFTATVTGTGPGTGNPSGGTVQFVVDGVNYGSPVALTGGSATSGSTSSLTAGPHSVTASYSGDPSFNGSTSTAFTQTVNKAPLTVTGNDKSKNYGDPDPAFDVSYSGFVNGDNQSALGGSLTFNFAGKPPTSYGPSSIAPTDAGTYAIRPSGLTSSNYDITFKGGTYTISKVASTTVVAFEAGPYVYRGTAFTATATVTGLGGLNASVPVVYSGDCTNVTVANGCTATATYGGDTNHIGSSDTKSITISPATSATVVTFEPGPYVYRGTPFTAAAQVTGVGGLSASVPVIYAGDCTNVTVSNGCTATATYGGDANHVGGSDSKSITITQQTPTVSVTGGTFVDNAQPHGATGFAYGVGGQGDVLAPPVTFSYTGTGATTYGPTTTEPSMPGTYLATGTFAGNQNYTPASASAAITITNAPPQAQSLTLATNEDVPLPITLRARDLDSANLTFTITSGPSKGSLEIIASTCTPNGLTTLSISCSTTVTYSPNTDYNGPDSFKFKVNDGELDSAEATVSITVHPVNDPPTANAQLVTTDDATPLAVTLTGSDVETAASNLTFTIVDQPLHGTLGGTPPNVTYVPDIHYKGPDSFTFTVTDRGDPDNCGTPSESCADIKTSPKATVSITVTDGTPPHTLITNLKPATLSNDRNPAFGFSGTDNVTDPGALAFECSLDYGQFSACGTASNPTTSYSNLGDGSHIFQVRAKDDSGNVDPNPPSYTWTIDATPPDTAIDSHPTPNAYSLVNTSTATFTFHATENNSTLACSIDGQAAVDCSGGTKTYVGLADGTHTFTVAATDQAGNTDPTPASYTWTIDTTAPQTSIDSGPSNPAANTTATFFFHGSDPAGQDTFGCSLDGAAFATCTSPMTYTALSLGQHTFEVQATDRAGNTDTTPASYSWTVGQVVLSSYAVDTDFKRFDGFDVIFGGGGKGLLKLNSTNPDSFHYQVKLLNNTGTPISPSNGSQATAIVTVPGMPASCGGVPCSPQIGALGDPAFVVKGKKVAHIYPGGDNDHDGDADDVPVSIQYLTQAQYVANGNSCADNHNNLYSSTLPPGGAAKCIKITGFTIPVKHAARIRINFQLRLKGVDGWDPNSKTLFYAGFVFGATTSVNIGSSVQTGYDATGIVGAGSKVSAVGGYAFSGVTALTGYSVRLFGNPSDASCSVNTKLVAQDTVDANGFYYVSRTGTDQHNAAAPSLPAGVRYAVQLCNGTTPLALQTLDSRLGDKEFEEIDFDLAY